MELSELRKKIIDLYDQLLGYGKELVIMIFVDGIGSLLIFLVSNDIFLTLIVFAGLTSIIFLILLKIMGLSKQLINILYDKDCGDYARKIYCRYLWEKYGSFMYDIVNVCEEDDIVNK